MARRLAVNKFLVKDGDSYIGLPIATTPFEATQEMERLGLAGEIITREDYEQSRGKVEQKRRAKIANLKEKLGVIDILPLIKDECLTAKGLKAKKIANKINQLESAAESDIDAYDPDTDADIA